MYDCRCGYLIFNDSAWGIFGEFRIDETFLMRGAPTGEMPG